MTAGGAPPEGFPRGFDGHRRAQAGIGLSMTPAERLRWLEETMAAMRRWLGRARPAPPVAGAGPPDVARAGSDAMPGGRGDDAAPGAGADPASRRPPS